MPQIITKEIYDLTQAEIKRRSEMRGNSKTNDGRYSSKYSFSKKIVCGECGENYRRHAYYNKEGQIRTWVCARHKTSPSDCHQKYIEERQIEEAFVIVLNDLVGDIAELKEILKENIAEALLEANNEESVKIDKELDKLQGQMLELHKRRISKTCNQNYHSNQLFTKR